MDMLLTIYKLEAQGGKRGISSYCSGNFYSLTELDLAGQLPRGLLLQVFLARAGSAPEEVKFLTSR